MLEIESDEAIYEIEFGQFQFEITNSCNLSCRHCRMDIDNIHFMTLDLIENVLEFATKNANRNFEVVISGGEPLLHPDFKNILNTLKQFGADNISLTTNGILLNQDHIEYISNLNFKRFIVSVSLDSDIEEEHNKLRQNNNAFQNAVNALKLITNNKNNIQSCIRATIQPNKISFLDNYVKLALAFKCNRISFSSVYPAGNALNNEELFMTQAENRYLLDNIYKLKQKYNGDIYINTNDPLKCLMENNEMHYNDSNIKIDGCPAGIVSFTVKASGDIMPCPFLNEIILNASHISASNIAKKYSNSNFIRSMLDRKFVGKCQKCSRKYSCGGCRARALAFNGNIWSDDPYCWVM